MEERTGDWKNRVMRSHYTVSLLIERLKDASERGEICTEYW
jgi:hypothetical protein